jgi:hypothetical protein
MPDDQIHPDRTIYTMGERGRHDKTKVAGSSETRANGRPGHGPTVAGGVPPNNSRLALRRRLSIPALRSRSIPTTPTSVFVTRGVLEHYLRPAKASREISRVFNPGETLLTVVQVSLAKRQWNRSLQRATVSR